MKRVSIALLSGGKDSVLTTAKCIEKRGKRCEVVFLDTKWEHIETYKYIALLKQLLKQRYKVKLHHLQSIGMKELILKKQFFPSLFKRYCTYHLKLKRFYEWLQARFENEKFELVEIWSGLRKEESKKRQRRRRIEIVKKGRKANKDIPKMPFHLVYVHPILDYRENEVFAELKLLNIPINPLYGKGHKRVGCYPCLISSRSIKDVIRDALTGDKFAQQRICEIKELENTLEVNVKNEPIDKLIKKELLLNRQKSLF